MHFVVVILILLMLVELIRWFIAHSTEIFMFAGGGVILLVLFGIWVKASDDRKAEKQKVERARTERNKREAEEKEALLRQKERDKDTHEMPCVYEIGRHANETLALRYGIANTKNDKELRSIRMKKIKPLTSEPNAYLVELTDYRDRYAVAIHEKGTAYIPTFYPLDRKSNDIDRDWFDRNEEVELVLKGNSSMTIKEIAKFHIDKTIGAIKS